MNGTTTKTSLPIILNETGFVAKKSAAHKYITKSELDKRSIKLVTYSGYTKIFPFYEEFGGGEYIKLPREIVFEIPHRIINKLPAQVTMPNSRTMLVELSEGQKLIVNYLFENYFTPQHIKAGRAGCVLNQRAGTGKTYVAAALISRINLKALYVVQTKVLQKQTIEAINFALGDGAAVEYKKQKITSAGAVAVAVAGGSGDALVTVIIDKSLNNMSADQLRMYSAIVYDEVHTMASPMNLSFLWNHQFHYQIGLTGTPFDREDKLDALYQHLIGRVVSAEGDVPKFSYDDIQFNTEVEIVHYAAPSEYCKNLVHESTGKMFPPYMYEQFMNDPQRNALLLEYIQKLYKRGDYVYVFASERKTLNKLRDLIPTSFVVEIAEEVETFMGGTSDEQMKNIIGGTAKIVLATYSYAGTGVSIAQMNSIIFATPRKAKMKQIIARILRRNGDATIKRTIIDIVDANTGFKHQLRKRKLAYKFYGATLIKKVVKAHE